jgi:RNA polymerase sigma-70 factor, ECF subfamily
MADPDIAQLVAEHHQAVYRYAYRLTRSVQDAEDLTQQAFLAAQRKMRQLRNVGSARSWLYAILRNRFLKDRLRRRPALATDLPLNLESVTDAPPIKDGDGDRLQGALNRLPDASRLVVLMFYFEECSYREIAERLNVPIGTVMSRLARAKGHLRSLLFEPEPKDRKRPVGATAHRG